MKSFVFAMACLGVFPFVRNDPSDWIECAKGTHQCGDNSKCVSDKDLCDFQKDCDDYSDERFAMCSIYHRKRGSCSDSGQVHHSNYGCRTISTVCEKHSSYYNEQQFAELCNEIEGGLKPDEGFTALSDEVMLLNLKILKLQNEVQLEELFHHLAVSFNESKGTINESDCPPLYLNVGGRCVAFFSVATVTWAEAKQFCESIDGTLAIVRKMKDYEALLKHLKNQELTTNFWIGGLFQSKLSGNPSWRWLDEKDIVMGAPFWSLHYSSTCTKRGASETCYRYFLAPVNNADGYCLSMDYEYHFYFADQNCHEKRSPLCFLN